MRVGDVRAHAPDADDMHCPDKRQLRVCTDRQAFHAAPFFCQLGMGWPEGVNIGRLDMVRQLLTGLALGVGVIRAALLGMSTKSEVGACDRC